MPIVKRFLIVAPKGERWIDPKAWLLIAIKWGRVSYCVLPLCERFISVHQSHGDWCQLPNVRLSFGGCRTKLSNFVHTMCTSRGICNKGGYLTGLLIAIFSVVAGNFSLEELDPEEKFLLFAYVISQYRYVPVGFRCKASPS